LTRNLYFKISKIAKRVVSSPLAGEDAAKRQVRGLAKSINRKAQTQSVSLSFPLAVIAGLTRNLKPHQLSEVPNV
jgi:hypothetical protein